MVPLSGRLLHVPEALQEDNGGVFQITHNPSLPYPLRARSVFVRAVDAPREVDGFAYKIAFSPSAEGDDTLQATPSLNYLSEGDVIRVSPNGKIIRVLYRRNSPHNFFLVTERCNHYCLMCSQPPKTQNDDWLLDDIMAAIPLINRSADRIGITGGEPTLLGGRFVRLINRLHSYLPTTALHVLSNGRTFSSSHFADEIADIRHPNLTFAIPLYSDLPAQHDHIVQAEGAFDDTIRGILALKERGQRVEVRVVLHRLSIERLQNLAEFIYRNLTFVDHVALMGLEVTGFAKANLEALWIDPWDYRRSLANAASYLDRMGVNVSIFNHQLCTLEREVWHLSRKSISDWKNEYEPNCTHCSVRHECGGFFATSTIRRSVHIAPISQ